MTPRKGGVTDAGAAGVKLRGIAGEVMRAAIANPAAITGRAMHWSAPKTWDARAKSIGKLATSNRCVDGRRLREILREYSDPLPDRIFRGLTDRMGNPVRLRKGSTAEKLAEYLLKTGIAGCDSFQVSGAELAGMIGCTDRMVRKATRTNDKHPELDAAIVRCGLLAKGHTFRPVTKDEANAYPRWRDENVFVLGPKGRELLKQLRRVIYDAHDPARNPPLPGRKTPPPAPAAPASPIPASRVAVGAAAPLPSAPVIEEFLTKASEPDPMIGPPDLSAEPLGGQVGSARPTGASGEPPGAAAPTEDRRAVGPPTPEGFRGGGSRATAAHDSTGEPELDRLLKKIQKRANAPVVTRSRPRSYAEATAERERHDEGGADDGGRDRAKPGDDDDGTPGAGGAP